jgi:outer membrane translocation and assembly module TamA
LLAQERPYGTGTYAQMGGALELSYDTRDNGAAPTTGVRASSTISYTPELLSVDRGAIGAVDADVAAYASMFGNRHTLAARANARKVFGEFPIPDAAFLGGPETLRGFRMDRFAGDASTLGSLELRSHVGHFRFLFPNELGVVAFGEAGRVFVEGRSPGGWHIDYGGGLWIAPVSRAHAVTMTVARSNEYTAFYLSTGFAF